MSNEEKLKSVVERKFNELQEFAKEYNKKATNQREKLMKEHKVAFEKDPESVNIEEIAKDMFYLNGFYQADIRKLQTELLDYYTISKEIAPEVVFSEDIEATVGVLKANLPKQIFTLDNGEFKEIEKGKQEELIKDFEKKGYYKLFADQVKKVLNA